jgi:hypothetical protein
MVVVMVVVVVVVVWSMLCTDDQRPNQIVDILKYLKAFQNLDSKLIFSHIQHLTNVQSNHPHIMVRLNLLFLSSAGA